MSLLGQLSVQNTSGSGWVWEINNVSSKQAKWGIMFEPLAMSI